MSALPEDAFGTPHGTDSKYRGGCRCENCRAAHTEALRKRRERKQAWPVLIPDRAHGTEGGYSNHGCRCDLCKDAHRLARNAMNARNRAMRNWSASHE